jgi:hypothetical protein
MNLDKSSGNALVTLPRTGELDVRILQRCSIPKPLKEKLSWASSQFSSGGVVLDAQFIARVQNNSYKPLGIHCASDRKRGAFPLPNLHHPSPSLP